MTIGRSFMNVGDDSGADFGSEHASHSGAFSRRRSGHVPGKAAIDHEDTEDRDGRFASCALSILVGLACIPVSLIVTIAASALFLGIGSLDLREIQRLGQTVPGGVLLMFPGQAANLVLALGAALLSGGHFRRRLGIVNGRVGLAGWLLLIVATPFVGVCSTWILQQVAPNESESLRLLTAILKSQPALLAALLVVISPGIAEELLFRGYVQTGLLRGLPPWFAIVITSLLFALAHLDPAQALGVFPLGLWVGVIAWRCGSIWPAILCHIMNNAVALVSISDHGVAEPGLAGDSFASSGIWLTVVSGGAFFASLWMMYRASPRGDE